MFCCLLCVFSSGGQKQRIAIARALLKVNTTACLWKKESTFPEILAFSA